MPNERPTAFELFNTALDAVRRGQLPDALLLLRGAFFENLYIAPLLIGQECHPQRIWYSSAEAGPQAAEEYVSRYGRLWKAEARSLVLLAEIWEDSLVRAELRSFINISRNILQARSQKQLSDFLAEREMLMNPERLRRTQSEILARLDGLELPPPVTAPRLALVLLASRDPAASVAFFRNLLGLEPRTTSALAGGFAEFDVEGVRLAVHGLDRAGAGDPYRLGDPPASLGWGAIFVFHVSDLDRYYGNATAAGLPIVDSDLRSASGRYFVVKDPSGYLIELTEEEPRGFQPR